MPCAAKSVLAAFALLTLLAPAAGAQSIWLDRVSPRNLHLEVAKPIYDDDGEGPHASVLVESPHLREAERPHGPAAVGGPVQRLVVQHHDDAVRRAVHVELEAIGARGEPGGERRDGILRLQTRGASVCEETRARAVEVSRPATPGRRSSASTR